MKILFIATSEFAVLPLKKLIENGFNIEAVITQPDKSGGRGKRIIQSPVKLIALEHNLNILQPENINSYKIKEFIKTSKIDIGVVISYGQIISSEIFNLPKYKIVNVHPSLLPKYRGPSPIQSCLLNGDKETGVSIIEISEKMDSGDILKQASIKILEDDDYFTLHCKLSDLGARLLVDVINNIKNLKKQKQHEAQATYCKLISKQNGAIDWTQTCTQIHNQIRALTKWPVAYTHLKGKILKIYKSKILYKDSELPPGSVERLSKKSFAVVCGNKQLLEILKLQLQGKKILNTADFINGINLKTGELLN
jgi:methionyl-tRNA formyltransferase